VCTVRPSRDADTAAATRPLHASAPPTASHQPRHTNRVTPTASHQPRHTNRLTTNRVAGTIRHCHPPSAIRRQDRTQWCLTVARRPSSRRFHSTECNLGKLWRHRPVLSRRKLMPHLAMIQSRGLAGGGRHGRLWDGGRDGDAGSAVAHAADIRHPSLMGHGLRPTIPKSHSVERQCRDCGRSTAVRFHGVRSCRVKLVRRRM
jgi:hypothetical protein